jgi:hypothetical protein
MTLASKRRWFATLIVGIMATSNGQAANVYFAPGDAFFHSELTEEFLNGLKDDASSITFLYEAPKGSLAFSGARGIARMEITAPSKHFIKGLRTAYEQATAGVHEFRESKDKDGTIEREEIDPPHLFIYNRDIDLKSQVIGLKYNESWHSLPDEAYQGAERGIEDKEIYYESFLKPKNAILEDWKNAVRFCHCPEGRRLGGLEARTGK